MNPMSADGLLTCDNMSKYDPLWKHVSDLDVGSAELSFDEVEWILGFPMDHSFLTFKKELSEYGWAVGKISMKNKTVLFQKD